jgi:ribosomal protein S27E
LLVKRRDSGFVSQNCLKCGKPAYVDESALPELECDMCAARLTVKKSTGGTTSTFAIDATETGNWLTHYLIGVNYSSIPGSQRAGITRRREVSLEHTPDANQLWSSREFSHAVFSSQQLRASPRPNGNDRKLIDLC